MVAAKSSYILPSNANVVYSDPQLVYPVGIMMLMLATLSVPFHLAKQTKIIAMVIVGVIFGPVLHLEEKMKLSLATMSSLFDIGILLTLFCGGMVVDVGVLKRHWNLVLINGIGQIVLNWGLFIGLGAALFSKKTNLMGVLYFGFCCQLSSPIVMERCLHKRGEINTLHGQIVLGRLLFQDVGAVLAMALLPAVADQTIVDRDSTAKSFSVGWIFVWLAVLLVFVYLLYRFVLRTLFRYCAVSSDLLFVAVYAYSFGVAAVFGWFLPTINGTGFSQEIGIFFAGVSIGALEYRLQIEAFVDPVKEFGLLLFFFILGITLPVRDTTTLSESLLQGLLIAVLIVFVCPSLMWLTGAISGLNSRCSFMLGNTVNQVGEFALILANFAKALGLFTDAMYVAVVVAFFLSIVLSTMCHEYADTLYDKLFKRLLSFLDAWCRVNEEHTHEFPMEQHVVLLGYNAIALAIAEYYRSVGQDVLVIQLDPKIHHGLRDLYKRGLAEQTAEKNQKRGALPASHTDGSERRSRGGEVGGGGGGPVTREQARLPVRELSVVSDDSGGVGSNIYSQYADPRNPDSWHHYNLENASMVVSCHSECVESDCVLARRLKKHDVPFVCVADRNVEAVVLYEAGVRFVIQSDAMAAHTFQRHLYDAELSKSSFFSELVAVHKSMLKKEEENNEDNFAVLSPMLNLKSRRERSVLGEIPLSSSFSAPRKLSMDNSTNVSGRVSNWKKAIGAVKAASALKRRAKDAKTLQALERKV